MGNLAEMSGLQTPIETAQGSEPDMLEPNGFTAAERDRAQLLFQRYDLDSSGTLNSWQEAQQITWNIVFSFDMVISQDDVEARMTQLRGVEEDEMEFEAYWAWFQEMFGG